MIRGLLVALTLVFISTSAVAQVAVTADTTGETEASAGKKASEVEPSKPVPVEDDAAKFLTFEGRLAVGHSHYLAGEYNEALSAYEKAKESDSGKPVVYYFIGCAKARLGNVDEGITALRTAVTVAGSGDKVLHAKALFMIAVLEEGRGVSDAASKAWTDYLGYAQTNSDTTVFVDSARARLNAIEKKQKLQKEYAVVNERIAAAKAAGEK